MTEEECEVIKEYYDKNKTPYIDAKLIDGTRIVTRTLRLYGAGGGGGIGKKDSMGYQNDKS